MALGLGDASNKIKYRRKTVNNGTTAPNPDVINNMTNNEMSSGHGQKRTLQEEDYIFPLDEDHMVETPTPSTNLPPYGIHSFKLRKTSPSRPTIASNAKTTSSSFRNRYVSASTDNINIHCVQNLTYSFCFSFPYAIVTVLTSHHFLLYLVVKLKNI